jgi:hypothetical protein
MERARRLARVQAVLARFGNSLPSTRLLCFLDDEDPPSLKRTFGAANRGLYGPIHDNTPVSDWPYYVTNCVFLDDGISTRFPRVVDDLVYLYGSVWTNEAGMSVFLPQQKGNLIHLQRNSRTSMKPNNATSTNMTGGRSCALSVSK